MKSQSKYEKTSQIIEKNYPKILNEMQDEGYSIQYDDFDVLIEIEDNGEVIGFYTLELINYMSILNEIYIIKSFRGQNFISQIFSDIYLQPNTDLYIRNPNYNFINSLIKYGYAIKLNNNLIYSFFYLIASNQEIYKNRNIKKFYKNGNEDFIYTSFYNDDIKCCVFNNSNFMKKQEIILLTEPRKSDIKKYHLRKKLKNITPYILRNINQNIDKSVNECQEYEDKTYYELIENNSINSFLKDAKNIIKQNDISNDVFEKIIKNIEKSIENNEIYPRFAKIRLNYLIKNKNHINKKLNYSLLPDKCPFCESNLDSSFLTCPVCAFELSQDSNMENYDNSNLIYGELLNKVRKNNWDLNEVYEAQCQYASFEFIKLSDRIKFLPMKKCEESSYIKKGSIAKYGLSKGYFEECSYSRYLDIIKNYDKDHLELEAEHYGLKPKKSKKAILKQIEKSITPDMRSIKYVITQKGKDFVKNNEFLNFFHDNLHEFIYYEFKNFFESHDESIDDIEVKFIEYIYKNAIKTKNCEDYKKYLYYNINENGDSYENLKLIIKIIICDFYIDNLDYINDFGIDHTAGFFFIIYKFKLGDCDLKEIYDEAFQEFEIDEFKKDKEYIYKQISAFSKRDTYKVLKNMGLIEKSQI